MKIKINKKKILFRITNSELENLLNKHILHINLILFQESSFNFSIGLSEIIDKVQLTEKEEHKISIFFPRLDILNLKNSLPRKDGVSYQWINCINDIIIVALEVDIRREMI